MYLSATTKEGLWHILSAVYIFPLYLLLLWHCPFILFKALAALRVLSAIFKELINVKVGFHFPWRLIENTVKLGYAVCSRYCFKLLGSRKAFKLPATSFWTFNKIFTKLRGNKIVAVQHFGRVLTHLQENIYVVNPVALKSQALNPQIVWSALGKGSKNIARGTTDPGYWLFNLSYLSSSIKWHLHWLQIWPPDWDTCISSKFVHQMAPLEMVTFSV